ncbi:hypothetical protein MTR67_040139 [Solanum verrucosum]|uniref:Uncharacterized protein n=1 Tax=Solanum verrucosum TaxID=315347 RepID=A0AAF0UKA1_SOLVR|nr:hypothetical protein MTR67_040139 [Solanum verrucosum]
MLNWINKALDVDPDYLYLHHNNDAGQMASVH